MESLVIVLPSPSLLWLRALLTGLALADWPVRDGRRREGLGSCIPSDIRDVNRHAKKNGLFTKLNWWQLVSVFTKFFLHLKALSQSCMNLQPGSVEAALFVAALVPPQASKSEIRIMRNHVLWLSHAPIWTNTCGIVSTTSPNPCLSVMFHTCSTRLPSCFCDENTHTRLPREVCKQMWMQWFQYNLQSSKSQNGPWNGAPKEEHMWNHFQLAILWDFALILGITYTNGNLKYISLTHL